MFKTTKDMFYKQFDFLQIDRADYGASWTLSFAKRGSIWSICPTFLKIPDENETIWTQRVL